MQGMAFQVQTRLVSPAGVMQVTCKKEYEILLSSFAWRNSQPKIMKCYTLYKAYDDPVLSYTIARRWL